VTEKKTKKKPAPEPKDPDRIIRRPSHATPVPPKPQKARKTHRERAPIRSPYLDLEEAAALMEDYRAASQVARSPNGDPRSSTAYQVAYRGLRALGLQPVDAAQLMAQALEVLTDYDRGQQINMVAWDEVAPEITPESLRNMRIPDRDLRAGTWHVPGRDGLTEAQRGLAGAVEAERLRRESITGTTLTTIIDGITHVFSLRSITHNPSSQEMIDVTSREDILAHGSGYRHMIPGYRDPGTITLEVAIQGTEDHAVWVNLLSCPQDTRFIIDTGPQTIEFRAYLTDLSLDARLDGLFSTLVLTLSGEAVLTPHERTNSPLAGRDAQALR
jgi:hypothetical protein